MKTTIIFLAASNLDERFLKINTAKNLCVNYFGRRTCEAVDFYPIVTVNEDVSDKDIKYIKSEIDEDLNVIMLKGENSMLFSSSYKIEEDFTF